MKDSIKESLDKIRLLESQQVDEYSWRQGANDVHAALRGATHGLSLGFDDNILAGINSLTGTEPDYKTALQKQMANTADIKSKASSTKFDVTNPFTGKKHEFNPSVYDAGDAVGFGISTPIPAVLGAKTIGKVASKGVGNFLGKGVGAVGGLATGLGANLGAAISSHIAKNKWDEKTTGLSQSTIDSWANLGTEKIKELQAELKVPETGKLDYATIKAAGESALGSLVNETTVKNYSQYLEEGWIDAYLKKGGTTEIERILTSLIGKSGNDAAKVLMRNNPTLFLRLQAAAEKDANLVNKDITKMSATEFENFLKSASEEGVKTLGDAKLVKGPNNLFYWELPLGQKLTQGNGFPNAASAMTWAKHNSELLKPKKSPENWLNRVSDNLPGKPKPATPPTRTEPTFSPEPRAEPAPASSGTGTAPASSGTGTANMSANTTATGGTTTIHLNQYFGRDGLTSAGQAGATRVEGAVRSVDGAAADAFEQSVNASVQSGSTEPIKKWWKKFGSVLKWSATLMAVLTATWIGQRVLGLSPSDGTEGEEVVQQPVPAVPGNAANPPSSGNNTDGNNPPSSGNNTDGNNPPSSGNNTGGNNPPSSGNNTGSTPPTGKVNNLSSKEAEELAKLIDELKNSTDPVDIDLRRQAMELLKK